MLKALLLFALVAFVVADDSQVKFKDSNITFKFADGNPSFSFFDNDNDTDIFSFNLVSLEEMNNGDSINKIDLTDAGNAGKWKQDADNFTQYTSTFTVGDQEADSISLYINATFYEDEETISVGDDTVHVPENSLKWTIHIAGWNLLNTSSTLHLAGTGLASNGSTSEWKDDKNLFVGAKKHWMWVNFPQMANTQYDADATNYNATVSVNATAVNHTKNDGSESSFTIVLPYFESDIAYDPTVTISDNSSEGTSSGGSNVILLIIIACVAGAIVAIILAFVVVLLLRRKRSQYEAV